MFSQSATKYVDNLIEVFTTDIDAITGEELRVATREGDLQDPNPAARIGGLVIKPPQNATELAYGMSEMMTYTANMRTKNPAYDRAYNTMVAPMLEKAAERLMRDPKFTKGSVDERRSMLKTELKTVRSAVTKYFKDVATGDSALLGLRRTAATKGSAEAKRSAKKFMRGRGVEIPISEMSYSELALYMNYLDLYKDTYE